MKLLNSCFDPLRSSLEANRTSGYVSPITSAQSCWMISGCLPDRDPSAGTSSVGKRNTRDESARNGGILEIQLCCYKPYYVFPSAAGLGRAIRDCVEKTNFSRSASRVIRSPRLSECISSSEFRVIAFNFSLNGNGEEDLTDGQAVA